MSTKTPETDEKNLAARHVPDDFSLDRAFLEIIGKLNRVSVYEAKQNRATNDVMPMLFRVYLAVHKNERFRKRIDEELQKRNVKVRGGAGYSSVIARIFIDDGHRAARWGRAIKGAVYLKYDPDRLGRHLQKKKISLAKLEEAFRQGSRWSQNGSTSNRVRSGKYFSERRRVINNLEKGRGRAIALLNVQDGNHEILKITFKDQSVKAADQLLRRLSSADAT